MTELVFGIGETLVRWGSISRTSSVKGSLPLFLVSGVLWVGGSLTPSQFSLISPPVTALFSYMGIELVGHILYFLSREELTVCRSE